MCELKLFRDNKLMYRKQCVTLNTARNLMQNLYKGCMQLGVVQSQYMGDAAACIVTSCEVYDFEIVEL